MSVKQPSGGSSPEMPKTNFITETVTELKKTNWPTPEQGVKMTWVVLVVIFVFTAYLFLADFVLSHFWKLIIPPKPL